MKTISTTIATSTRIRTESAETPQRFAYSGDATRILLTDETLAWVVDMIDDHPRYLLSAIAGEKTTTDLARDVRNGLPLPRQVLSDNRLAFTGRLHDVEVAFEANLADLGVQLINAPGSGIPPAVPK